MKPLHKPEICTCGHPSGAHFEGAAPVKELAYACSFVGCKCTRYDRRTFTDPELEQLALEQLERQRATLQAARTEAAPASTAPDPLTESHSLRARRVLALERLGLELGRLVDHLERVDQRKNPCPNGGPHIWVYRDERISQCQNCPEVREKGPPELRTVKS